MKAEGTLAIWRACCSAHCQPGYQKFFATAAVGWGGEDTASTGVLAHLRTHSRGLSGSMTRCAGGHGVHPWFARGNKCNYPKTWSVLCISP